MGAVEDVRKALQDVVAPDLEALQVEVKEGFASVEKQFAAVKDGFASVEKLAAIRHDLLLAELRNALAIAESRHEAILKALDLDVAWSGSKRGRHRSKRRRKLRLGSGCPPAIASIQSSGHIAGTRTPPGSGGWRFAEARWVGLSALGSSVGANLGLRPRLVYGALSALLWDRLELS